MKYLHGKLSDPTTHLNVRLFVSKMIVNSEEVRFNTNVPAIAGVTELMQLLELA